MTDYTPFDVRTERHNSHVLDYEYRSGCSTIKHALYYGVYMLIVAVVTDAYAAPYKIRGRVFDL